MKRALKLIGWSILWVVCALVFAVLFVLATPSSFLNTKTVASAVKRFGGSYRPKWKELTFEVRSPGYLTKRLVLHAAGFCFDARDGSMKGCFALLDLDATVHLGLNPFVSVERLDRLTVRETSLAVDETLAPETPAQKKKKKGHQRYTRLPQLLPAPLRSTKLGNLDVRIPSAAIKTSSGSTQARLTAAFDPATSRPLTADAFVVTRDTSSRVSNQTTAALRLDSDVFRKGELSYLDARARVRSTQGLNADVSAKAQNAGKRSLRLLAKAVVRLSGRELRADLNGLQTPRRYLVKGTLAVLDPSGPVRRLALDDCRFEAALKPDTSHPEKADLSCLLRALPKPLGLAQGQEALPLDGRLKAHVDFKPKLAKLEKDYFEAKISADVGPAKNLYDFYVRFSAELAGRTGDIPDSLKAKHKLETGLRVAKFQDLVAYLKGTAWAVPAPLHTLDGPIVVEARTAGDSRGPSQTIDYKATTDLSGGRQAVAVDVRGSVLAKDLFRPDRSFEDKTQVDLKKVALQLPYLKVGAAPAFTVDKRINTGTEKSAQAVAKEREGVRQSTVTNVAYDAHVFTSAPIILYSNLAKDPVPIHLDLSAKTAGMTGAILLKTFRMEVFRQLATIDHIKLTPTPGTSDLQLDGLVVYKKNDVTIDIQLLGSTDHPQVSFSSDPPMTQDEIIGVLLFGKSPAELDVDQQATVGNAATAMTSGAFGLASLYLFASTPIEYVGYDPTTQSYQIKFKLPGGATLSVGSDLEESRTVTLRKRVARHLEIETELQQNTQTGQQRSAITTFLQFFQRY